MVGFVQRGQQITGGVDRRVARTSGGVREFCVVGA